MLDSKKKKVHVHFTFSRELKEELEKCIEERKRSQFVSMAIEKELQRLKMQQAIDKSFGAWTEENHPELPDDSSTYKYVRKLRTESDGRLKDLEK
jgi:hypothetical protein